MNVFHHFDNTSRTREDDSNLSKYFFANEGSSKHFTKNHDLIVEDPKQKEGQQAYQLKLNKFFKKQIRLKNALKQCYWDRKEIVFL
jgi:hypothetical protein